MNSGPVSLLQKPRVDMKRVVERTLPNGRRCYVYPYHVCLEGLETLVLCREDEDYDAVVKYISVCAQRKNVIVITYAVVSNHCHCAILARNQEEADAYAQELKRMCAMWFSKKYNEKSILKKCGISAILIDNDWYLRNALSYILRNALDNGCDIHKYHWCGYSAAFGRKDDSGTRMVAGLSKRERRAIMHTDDDLRHVLWRLDKENRLLPASICDTDYMEQAFEHDPAFFLKSIGSVNTEEMRDRLVVSPRTMQPDTEFYKRANDTAKRWFGAEIGELPVPKKLRLVPYLFRTGKTTARQMGRALGLEKELIERAINFRGSQPYD